MLNVQSITVSRIRTRRDLFHAWLRARSLIRTGWGLTPKLDTTHSIAAIVASYAIRVGTPRAVVACVRVAINVKWHRITEIGVLIQAPAVLVATRALAEAIEIEVPH